MRDVVPRMLKVIFYTDSPQTKKTRNSTKVTQIIISALLGGLCFESESDL